MSFLFPSFCIGEAKNSFLDSIDKANRNVFDKKGLKLSYKSKCSTSWLQIDILDREARDEIRVHLNTDDRKQEILISNQLK